MLCQMHCGTVLESCPIRSAATFLPSSEAALELHFVAQFTLRVKHKVIQHA